MNIVQRAMEAFWASVAHDLPHIKTGDLDPLTAVRFEEACSRVILEWIRKNEV